jgi:hypothetical protein
MKEKETKKTNDAGILKLIAFCALLQGTFGLIKL